MPAVLEKLTEQQGWAQREREYQPIYRLLERSEIPQRFKDKTLANFATETAEQARALQVACDYVATFPDNLAAGRSMLWCGPAGTGKTHLACGMLRALAVHGYEVLYITAAGIIRWLRETWRKGSDMTEDEVIQSLAKPTLLVVDEVGVGYGTDAEKIQLFEIVNARYNAVRPTLMLSNLDREGLQAYLGDRVIDRFRENNGTVLVFSGESWRARS